MGRLLPNRRATGFTLIEVLVALAVIAVAMAAIVRSTTVSAGNAGYLKDRTLAHWVAMNKIAELQLEGTWPGVGLRKGEYDMADHEWRWETTVSETEDNDVRRMDVKVFRGPQSKEALAVVVAYVGRTP